jgi:fluoroquinolone resistance protein
VATQSNQLKPLSLAGNKRLKKYPLMNTKLIEFLNFDKIDCTVKPLEKAEYDHCNFLNCNFYESDVSDITFSSCRFENCDFSLARCMKAVFNDVRFVNCKLLGLHFDNCNPLLLSVYFENCLIRISSFYRLKLKKTKFIRCNLQEADFTDADLSGALFDNCDLQGALFENTNLERADLFSSYHFSIDPEKNRIRKARFSKAEIAGLLHKYDIEIL